MLKNKNSKKLCQKKQIGEPNGLSTHTSIKSQRLQPWDRSLGKGLQRMEK